MLWCLAMAHRSGKSRSVRELAHRADAGHSKLPPLSSLSADAGSGKKPVQGEWLCYCFIESEFACSAVARLKH